LDEIRDGWAVRGVVVTYQKRVYDSPEDAEDRGTDDEAVGNGRLEELRIWLCHAIFKDVVLVI